MSTPRKTSNDKLVSALRILAGEIESPDGVANMTIAEGELHRTTRVEGSYA